MSVFSACVEYSSSKNCFISLPQNRLQHLKPCITHGLDKQSELYVFEMVSSSENKVYVSHQSSADGASTSVRINGLYSEKLGIQCDEEVQLTPLLQIQPATRVYIEPFSIDDWEMTDIHSDFIESHLLDQVRVVWVGQVLLVWESPGVKIHLKISMTDPIDKCVLLMPATEVVIAPKDRQPLLQRKQKQEPDSNPPSRTPSDPWTRAQDSILGRMFPMAKSDWTSYITSFWSRETTEGAKPADSSRITYSPLNSSMSLALRVQAFRGTDAKLKHSNNVRSPLGFVCVTRDTSEYVSFPTTVFVKTGDVEQQTGIPAGEIPEIFYCSLKKLTAPNDSDDASSKLKEEIKAAKDPPLKHEVTMSKKLSLKSSPVLPVVEFTPIVKVVTVDKYSQSSDKGYLQTVFDIQNQFALSRGHVVISNSLRRQLKLEVTGRVQLSGMTQAPSGIEVINIHVLSSLPATVTNEQVSNIFTHWMTEIIHHHGDVLIYHQTPVVLDLPSDDQLEVVLTLDVVKDDQTHRCRYGLVNSANVSQVKVVVKEIIGGGRRKMADISHFPVHSVTEFDHNVPDEKLRKLGGLSHLRHKCLMHVDLCLRERPLVASIVPRHSAGVQQGCLLITGARGTGKTTLGRALCTHVSSTVPYAYTVVVECKRMRGKRVDTIEKMLMKVFNEAAWRQPSVILLDDLDYVATASDTPEAEQSGEALYAARVADVIRNLLKMEANNLTRLCVIVTSQSRASIHHNLVHSRGFHVVHETVEITPPNKKQRKEIFESILRRKNMVNATDTLATIETSYLIGRMEGFVANDLTKVVNRAIHAQLLADDFLLEAEGDLILNKEAFDTALEGFTATSMRHISLHKEVELTWQDIGGLHEIRNILIETIEWPTKYSELFTNCPLRLRSGILLYGAPGTGKTLLAGIVARECGVNFISVKGPELLSKYIGASEQAVRDIFNRAQGAKPCVLFFDEFDSIAPRRGHDSTGVTDRVVNQLLTQLDGVESLQGVYVLAATSRPDLIDPALLRPGRLDKSLYCRLPTQAERVEIIHALSRRMNFSDDVDFDVVAELSTNFTGADIKALLYNAQLKAIRTSSLSQKFEYSIETDTESDSDIDSGINTLERAIDPDETMSAWDRGAGETVIAENAPLRGSGLVTVEMGRRMSFCYIPRLQDGGVQEVEGEQERQVLYQLTQLEKRARKETLGRVRPSVSFSSHLDELDDEPLVQVNQFHLLNELQHMRPSVSPQEHHRYEIIYQNVVSGRGAGLKDVTPVTNKRATLA